jgi:hypothetical protein
VIEVGSRLKLKYSFPAREEVLRLERAASFSISVIGWYVLPYRLIKKPSSEAAGNEDPGAYAVEYVRSLSD